MAAVMLGAVCVFPALAHQEVLSEHTVFTFGDWEGVRYMSESGAVHSCSVRKSGPGRDRLALTIRAGDGLAILVSREDQEFVRGAVAAETSIDDIVVSTTAQGFGTDVIKVRFDAHADATIYERLRTGHRLKIVADKSTHTFSLAELDKAMPALTKCVSG